MEARRLAYLEVLGLDALELRGEPVRDAAQGAARDAAQNAGRDVGRDAAPAAAPEANRGGVFSGRSVEALPWEDEAEASAREYRESALPAAMPPAGRAVPVPAAASGNTSPRLPGSPSADTSARLPPRMPASPPANTPTKVRAPHPAGALDWEPLAAAVAGCERCGLCAGRTRAVFGAGARRARWMVIGEAPGLDEDRDNDPCAGKAGELLTAMLRACGVQREDVFITNVLKCRPPDNRDPEATEVAECLPYLLNQMALVQPELVICLGRAPAQYLLGTDLPLAKLRGQVHRLQAPAVPLVVTYHPTYLLRAPQDKPKAWEDLQFAMAQVPPLAGLSPPLW